MSTKLAFSAALSVLLTASSLLLGTLPAEVPFGGGATRHAVGVSAGAPTQTIVDALVALIR